MRSVKGKAGSWDLRIATCSGVVPERPGGRKAYRLLLPPLSTDAWHTITIQMRALRGQWAGHWLTVVRIDGCEAYRSNGADRPHACATWDGTASRVGAVYLGDEAQTWGASDGYGTVLYDNVSVRHVQP